MGARNTFQNSSLLCSLGEVYVMSGILHAPQSIYLVKVEVLSFFMVPKFLKSVENQLRTTMLDKFFFFIQINELPGILSTGSWSDSVTEIVGL